MSVMKKSAILILMAITLIFVSFVAGVYCGKNYFYDGIPVEPSATPTTTAAPPTYHPETDPAATQHTANPTVPTAGTTKPRFPININTATVQELDLLPDIGPTRANAIVAYRQEYGPFTCVEDLLNVDGIGPKILEKILPYITV
jgi:competence protein ComEA